MSQSDDDRRIDDLIRAASARDVDQDKLYRSVLDQLEPQPKPSWIKLPSLGPNLVAAGFAAMLLFAGFAGYSLPDIGSDEDQFLALAIGQSGSLDLQMLSLDGGEGS